MGRLGSGKPKASVYPGVFDPKLGTFNSTLVGLQLYHSDNFNDKTKRDLNIGFILEIEDPDADHEPLDNGLYRHTEPFVRLQVDDEGNFGPGGSKAKAYKLISAYYGKDFNSFDDDFEWWFDFLDDVDFESIDDVPHFKDYDKEDEWLGLADIFIKPDAKTPERGIMGNSAMVKFGYAQKPDKTYSDKITIIEAVAMPKSSKTAKPAKPAKAAKKAAPEPEPEEAAPAPVESGATKLPRYITYVHEKVAELGIADEHFVGWFSYFTDQDFTDRNSFAKEQAKLFKTAYENDSDQITQSYEQYKEFILPAKEAVEEDDDFWEDDEDAA